MRKTTICRERVIDWYDILSPFIDARADYTDRSLVITLLVYRYGEIVLCRGCRRQKGGSFGYRPKMGDQRRLTVSCTRRAVQVRRLIILRSKGWWKLIRGSGDFKRSAATAIPCTERVRRPRLFSCVGIPRVFPFRVYPNLAQHRRDPIVPAVTPTSTPILPNGFKREIVIFVGSP